MTGVDGRCPVMSIAGARCRLRLGHLLTNEGHDYYEGPGSGLPARDVDTALIADLRRQLERVTAERDHARLELTTLNAELDEPRIDGDSERRGSAWWFVCWKQGNRRRAEMGVEIERLKASNRAVSLERNDLERNYLDVANALLPSSTGPAELVNEAHRLRAEVERLNAKLNHPFLDALRQMDDARDEIERMRPVAETAGRVLDAWRSDPAEPGVRGCRRRLPRGEAVSSTLECTCQLDELCGPCQERLDVAIKTDVLATRGRWMVVAESGWAARTKSLSQARRISRRLDDAGIRARVLRYRRDRVRYDEAQQSLVVNDARRKP